MMRSPTPINARAIFSEKQAHFGFTNGPCHKEASKLWAYELEILGGMLVGAEQGFYCPGFNPSPTSYNTKAILHMLAMTAHTTTRAWVWADLVAGIFLYHRHRSWADWVELQV